MTAEKVGQTSGLFAGLPEEAQQEALVDIMVSEAIKTSEIEGEYLSRQEVMNSIRNNIGFNQSVKQVADQKADGAARLMVTVREGFASELTEDMFFSWHSMLMSGSVRVKVGAWRDHKEPMQIISGPIGKEQIHYEALPLTCVPEEMAQFIRWFNETGLGGANEIKKPEVRSAIAHIYFEAIHSFDDGNGRIGRALSEKAMLQGVTTNSV